MTKFSQKTKINKPTAPRLHNTRHFVAWTQEGISEYEKITSIHLQRLQSLWLSTPSRSSTSLLIEAVNEVLCGCAKAFNQTFPLPPLATPKSRPVPSHIRRSSNQLLKQWKILRNLKKLHPADSLIIIKQTEKYLQLKRMHRNKVRLNKTFDSYNRDTKLLQNPKSTYAQIRRRKRLTCEKICELNVDGKIYVANQVPDGFHDSVKSLKTKNQNNLNENSSFNDCLLDYHNIIQICKQSQPVRPIRLEESTNILKRMKPTVADFFSVTPRHYLYAGSAGLSFFNVLLNHLLLDISSKDIHEINLAYASVLFKGHGKDRTAAKSYRTISTCPVVAKALDIYIRDLYVEQWNSDQSEVQFQGEGSSHELAGVLLTECIQYSTITLRRPLFVLYLDARSAFDAVQKELLIRNLYHVQNQDQSILYLNNRLLARQTVLDWGGDLMGPIQDQQGLEQGGTNSSDHYKIFGKSQLTFAQESKLGLKLGNLVVSSIGQADDTLLLSNDIVNLNYLLILTLIFCAKFLVSLCADKTKLQVFCSDPNSLEVQCAVMCNPISINGELIPFSPTAEHVGILRSPSGNGPSILGRFSAHRNALSAILHEGLAKGHRANPSLGLKLEKLYALPVLISGLPSLVLSEKEFCSLESYYRGSLQKLLRLHDKTPRVVIYFLAGTIPLPAILHQRQLALFGMICRLDANNILHRHARNIFSSATISKGSWLHQIRRWCVLYSLPHPSTILSSPPSKIQWKKLVKSKVVDYWEIVLREEAKSLKSLTYFKPDYMNITQIHPIFTYASNSPICVIKATITALMLSGRYRCGALTRHWDKHSNGICALHPQCQELEDIPHILKQCKALSATRLKLSFFTSEYVKQLHPELQDLILEYCRPDHPQFSYFILDCSTLPGVISIVQKLGKDILFHLFYFSRTWAYALHRERLKLLGLWKRSSGRAA